MKNFTAFLIITILTSQFIYAQLSQVFPTENAKWDVGIKCDDGGPNNVTYDEVEYTVGSDTIINGLSYSRFGDFAYSGFVRVEGDRVYFKDNETDGSNSPEWIAFDFGLEAGDMFYHPPALNLNQDFVVIESVDIVQFSDGIDRKRLKLSTPYNTTCGQTEYFVEGIGGMPTPFYWVDCFECEMTYFNFYDADNLVVQETIVGEESLIEQTEINIFPNPTKGNINIKSNDNLIQQIKIMNVIGTTIYQIAVNSNNVDLHLPSHLANGVYFIELKFKDSKSVFERLIKN